MEAPPTDELQKISRRYRAFADHEARGNSEAYYRLARAVADDEDSLRLLLDLPDAKRQPNLVFACLRDHGVPNDAGEFKALFAMHGPELVQRILTRSTQTNEPARNAALYLALSTVPRPIALVELGTSAGLCVIPDFYRYRFDQRTFIPDTASPDAPTLSCAVAGPAPAPRPDLGIAWRLGMDLSPIDLDDEASARWLETLVWPGQDERAGCLRGAIDLVRRVRPPLEAGDVMQDLARILDRVPPDLNLVIYHSAVVNYLPRADWKPFEAMILATGATWISMEDPRIFQHWVDAAGIDVPPGRFLLAKDRRPLAHVQPHGRDVVWLDSSPST